MRIISGKYKSRKLLSPKGTTTRPTEDRVKESLFNILTPIDSSAIVLDAFSGTGNIGLEFISRGVSSVVCCEKDRRVFDILKRNIKELGVSDLVSAYNMDVIKYLDINFKDKFNYIYIDPPYENINLYDRILMKIYKNKMINFDGIVIIEHVNEFFCESLKYYDLLDRRNYGSKYISFYRLKGDSL